MVFSKEIDTHIHVYFFPYGIMIETTKFYELSVDSALNETSLEIRISFFHAAESKTRFPTAL